MSQPRQKPWETSSGGASSQLQLGETIGATNSTINSGAPVALPDRPTSLSDQMDNVPGSSAYGSGSIGNNSYGGAGSYGSRYGSSYGGMGGGYGSSMYGSGMGGYGSSMYGSGMGGYGSSMYGGYGSSMYGGYGSSMYGGYGGMGSGMYGQPGMAGGPGGLGEGTQATFHLIESIIGAVGGFAQMLEATYMATHSSFFTMVNLAEQFGNLRNALGSLLGIFALIKFVKKIFYKITGSTYNYGINSKEFTKFDKKQKALEFKRQQQINGGGKKSISFKPLLLFLAASIGFPYLLNKAIQKINEKNIQQNQQNQYPPNHPGQIDPANLQFAKALYEFNPENPNIEVELKPNELVAILSKYDPAGNESKWWKVRSRQGKIGYVPSNYLQLIERKAITAPQPVSQAITNPAQPSSPNMKKLSVSDFENFQKAG